jgi:hypothetical protein
MGIYLDENVFLVLHYLFEAITIIIFIFWFFVDVIPTAIETSGSGLEWWAIVFPLLLRPPFYIGISFLILSACFSAIRQELKIRHDRQSKESQKKEN